MASHHDDAPRGLVTLARRAIRAIERAADEIVPTPAALNARLLAALRAAAAGDLTFAAVAPLAGTREGEALSAIVHRMRALVMLSRDALRRGAGAVERVGAAAAQVAETAARQRAGLERAAADVGASAEKAAALVELAREVADAADRASLLALNTGIEGLRAGGESARALTALGEEIRRAAQRAASGAAELAVEAAALAESARVAAGAVGDGAAASRSIVDEATRAAASAEGARRAERELSAVLDGYRLLDDETESLVAGIHRSAERLVREVREARVRIEGADPAARAAVDAAVEALARAARGE